jgi:hypothetical protein
MNWAVSNAGPATIRDSGHNRLPSKVVNDIQIHVLVVTNWDGVFVDDWRAGATRSRPAGGSGNAETLDYLNDIIRELKQLADKNGYRTLSAILGAALVEAHIQSGESEH